MFLFCWGQEFICPICGRKRAGEPCTVIPTVADVEDYREYVDEAKEAFRDLGFEVETLDLAKIDQETAQAKIFRSKLLYMSGGNSFYTLRKSSSTVVSVALVRQSERLSKVADKKSGAFLLCNSSTFESNFVCFICNLKLSPREFERLAS